jgi:hypothetical protein
MGRRVQPVDRAMIRCVVQVRLDGEPAPPNTRSIGRSGTSILPQQLSVRAVDKDLFRREVDIAILILRYSLFSVFSKERDRTECSI